MRFRDAYYEMKKGKKIRLPEWGGYWEWKNDTIMLNCYDGRVLDIRETEDVDYTFKFICREDWEVIEDDKDCFICNNGRVMYDKQVVDRYKREIQRLESENKLLREGIVI